MSIRRARRIAALGCVVVCALAATEGCLTRPVGLIDPTTKISFTNVLKQSTVDKVDLLVVVDNSSSMGDKQAYLREAVPDLVKRLVQPACLPEGGGAAVARGGDGECPAGSKPEFNAVHDMHIGVISSSLGARLGNMCDPNDKRYHNDDRGHLLNRAGADEHAQAVMGASSYLAFLPPVAENASKPQPSGATAIVDPSALVAAFQDAVIGVHQNGCGIESQLESFYRFLVQPDPYDSLDASSGVGAWVGVDSALLKQRHDFLRPDSLVLVLDLTDENDSEIDVRALGGQGDLFMNSAWQPPHGTSQCGADASDPACVSCSILPDPSRDASCAAPWSKPTEWGFDANLRHVHMKEKYGVDPQYPISRYAHGLSSLKVPNRDGEYPTGAHRYVGNDTCTNPLFAGQLPDGSSVDPEALCNLPRGPRTADMVYFAHIGGVPSALLHDAPDDPKRGKLDELDWKRILGNDPEKFDLSGIDPHMVESFSPRAGLPGPQSASNADAISGRESITDASGRVDLQYACTFALPQPRTCADGDLTCDCAGAIGRPSAQVPSVCDPKSPNVQSHAKAYPTVRELLLAKKMGDQGIVSSICPAHVTEQSPGDPLYGYRPAMTAIVDRLKSQLAAQCLPRPLAQDGAGAPCQVIEELPANLGIVKCSDQPGLVALSAQSQKQYDAQRLRDNPSVAAKDLPLACELVQIGSDPKASCANASEPGWCYVENDGACAQAIRFSKGGTPPNNAKLSLQCLEAL